MADALFRLWPCHFKPEADELFSSWMARLAIAHGITVQRLLVEGTGLPSSQMACDIDRGLRPLFHERLATKTASSLKQVERSTLLVYRRVLFPHHGDLTHWTWVRRFGTGVQFCPYCLYDDKIPYFRLHWRLALFTVCEVHNQLLMENCPVCGWPIQPRYYRQDRIRYHRIGLCGMCGYDLRSADPDGFSNDMITALAVFQQWVRRVISMGLFFDENVSHENPVDFFRRLRSRACLISLSFMRTEIPFIDLSNSGISISKKRIFESLPVSVRARALIAARETDRP